MARGVRGARSDKRRAILDGALTVFARDGYTRAGVDAIASEASVSTRTIYNHFADKAGLFHAVIEDSASRVAEHEIAIIDRYLHKITDLEADLIEFGLAWARQSDVEHHEDFWLTRHINAEARHVPPETMSVWRESGPLRVRRALATRLDALAVRGLLRVADPERAALHLLLLISLLERPFPPAEAPAENEVADMVTAGVRAFLHGYGS